MYIASLSLIKTLAAKHKCSMKKVIVQILNGKQMTYKGKHEGIVRKIEVFKSSKLGTPNSGHWRLDIIPVEYKTLSPKSEILSRMLAKRCEYCSKEKGYFEVHHVRKLADIKGKSMLDKVMIARRRKTMVLCVECHDLLHAGKLPDGRFQRKCA